MKRIITASALFFSFCLLGTLMGALFSMLCMDLTQFVIGTKLSLFSFDFFLKGLYLSFPLAAIISLLLLAMYQIRHPDQALTAFISYGSLNILTWFLLIPLMLLLSLRIDIRPPAASPSVSAGYFRSVDDFVYYWSKFSYDGTGEGLFIDSFGIHGTPGTVYPLHDAEKPEQKTPSTFADPLVLSAINMPQCVSIPLTAYLYLVYHARDMLSRSYLSWLLFATIGFALASVYALGSISSWRLLNAFIIIIAGVGIGLLNYALYASPTGNSLSGLWIRTFGSVGTRVPLAACANLLIGLLFTIAGVIRHASHRRASEHAL